MSDIWATAVPVIFEMVIFLNNNDAGGSLCLRLADH